ERVKEVEGQNDELNESLLYLQHKIISLENKLAELQQESESLAMQLQNAFHTSYEKGLQEGLKRNQPAPAESLGEIVEPQPIIQTLPEFEPSLDTGPLPPTQRHQLAEAAPEIEALQTTAVTGEHPQLLAEPAPWSPPQTEPEAVTTTDPSPVAIEISQATDRAIEQTVVETEPNTEVDSSAVNQEIIHNFAQVGPYTASDFNPLQDLRWRDLETVYDMGVLSVKDFENRPTTTSQDATESEQQTTGNRIPAFHDTTIFSEESMDLTGSSDSLTPLPPEAYGGTPKQIEAPTNVNVITDPIPDFDQLDIFEDMDELEELGKIEVPEDLLADIPIDEVQKRKAQGLPIVDKVEQTDEELRELVENRIKQAKEHSVDQTVRTPPAPGSSEEGAEKGGSSGLNKFVGGKSHPQGEGSARVSQSGMPAARVVPPEIRRHCQILGIQEIEGLSREVVTDAWKKLIALPGVHPDQGGDTESAIYLNTAKDALLRYIDDSTPKLGKKFGSQSSKEMSNRFTGRKKQEG
ncbi:MAG: hypothetical protein K8F91_18685, partial [Candidatus Obscuribacterales bacterium]|nr:hypothetical protein [Candidatus Obscuribacterales bacterium]